MVETVKLNKNQVSDFLSPVCSLYSDILGQCVDQVTHVIVLFSVYQRFCFQVSSSLQCSDIETGQEIVDFMINSPCESLDFATIESSADLANSLGDKTKQCASTSDIKTSAMSKERVGFVIDLQEQLSDDLDDEISNGRKPSKLGFRRKRQTLANLVTDLVQVNTSF